MGGVSRAPYLRLAALLCVASLSLTPAACTDREEPLTVGLIVPLTGDAAPLGIENQRFAELAVERLNAGGGMLGRKVRLVVKDDHGSPGASTAALEQLAGEKAVAVIGSPLAEIATATMPAVERHGIPYLSLAAAHDHANPVRPYAFGVPATPAAYAGRLLQYFQATGVTKIAVGHEAGSTYADAGLAATRARAATFGVTIVTTATFQGNANEFSVVLDELGPSGAQALLVWAGDRPAVALAKAFAQLKPGIPLALTGLQATERFLDAAGAASEGVVIPSPVGAVGGYLPASRVRDVIGELTAAFKAKYGYEPLLFARDGHTAVELLSAAVRAAKSTDRSKIRTALEGLAVLTSNGRYRYSPDDHSGLPSDALSVNTVRAGTLVPTDWAKERLATMTGN